MNYLKNVLNTVKKQSPILYSIAMIHLCFAIIATIGLLVDNRTLMGVNVWLKPLKFTISGAIYILTLGYYTTLYPFSTTKRNCINNLTSWTLLFEVGIIVCQGARGVQSHYNKSTVFDSLLFAAMGLLVAVNVLLMLFLIFETMRLKMKTQKSIQWAILFGWIIMVVGSWVGSQMINQMSHNIGIADGGEGLPIVNWSTVAGDLRVAHFFGLHGLQIIPLFAFWLSKKKKITPTKQLIYVTVFALTYAAFIAYVFYQAKQALPFIKL